MMLYQGGASCELLGASGKDPLKRWKAKASGGVKRLYDSGTRGYVYSIDGGAATRLALGDGAPRSSRGAHSLGLLHRYLVLQLELPPSDARPFAVELVVSDEKRNRRRVLLSSAFAAASRTPLHAQLPLGGAFEGKRGKWLHWRVDVAGLAKVAFGEAVALHALDGVAVGPSCRLRAVFTLRDAESPVPTSLALPAAVGYEEAVFPPDEAPGAAPEPPGPLGVFGTAIPRSEKAPPRNPTVNIAFGHRCAKLAAPASRTPDKRGVTVAANVPRVASLMGAVPGARDALLGPPGRASVLGGAVQLVSSAAVPVGIINLGGSVASKAGRSERGGDVAVPGGLLCAAVVIRLLVVPCLSCAATVALRLFAPAVVPPGDAALTLVLMLESTPPPAMQCMIFCQLFAQDAERPLGKVLVATYVCSLVTLTAWIALFLSLLSAG